MTGKEQSGKKIIVIGSIKGTRDLMDERPSHRDDGYGQDDNSIEWRSKLNTTTMTKPAKTEFAGIILHDAC